VSTQVISAIRRFTALTLCLLLLYAGLAQADECGLENGRPCAIAERVPSCNINLIENNYRCEAVACGKVGGQACAVTQRFVWDYFLAKPAPLPCDVDLVERNGTCVRLNCGAEGQAPCTIFDRIPSCNINLVEEPGRCLHPNCGRLGQVACAPSPKRRMKCDVHLVEQNGVCAKAGTPGAPAAGNHGATSVGGGGTYVPPPSPQPTNPGTGMSGGGTGTQPLPPPRPPAPQPGNPGAGTSGSGGNGSPPVPSTSNNAQEIDTDRMGNDIYGFPMSQADPSPCQSACNAHAQCQAWTYVKPGIKGPEAFCFLKNPTPAPTRNNCCVSGAKAATGPTPRSLLRRP